MVSLESLCRAVPLLLEYLTTSPTLLLSLSSVNRAWVSRVSEVRIETLVETAWLRRAGELLR